MAETVEAGIDDHATSLTDEQQVEIEPEMAAVDEISRESILIDDATLPPAPSAPSPVCSQNDSDGSDEGFGSRSVCEIDPGMLAPIAEPAMVMSGSPFASARPTSEPLSSEGREAEADSRDESPKLATSQISSPAPKQQNGTEHELRKFGLSAQDKVLESYSCALYPKKGLLAHGRMFITQHFVAFSGWKDMRVLLPMRNILKIEKTNTLLYIPNALTLTMEDKSEYFFGSFIDRDACVQMLKNLVEIERRILEIHGDDNTVSNRGLEFGYQTRQASASRITGGSLSLQSFLMGSDKSVSTSSTAVAASSAAASAASAASIATAASAAVPSAATVPPATASTLPPTSPSTSSSSVGNLPPPSSSLPSSSAPPPSPSTSALGTPSIPRFQTSSAFDSSKVEGIAENKEKERITPPGPLMFSELLPPTSEKAVDGPAASVKESSTSLVPPDSAADSVTPTAADSVAGGDPPLPTPRVDLSSLTNNSSVHWLWNSNMQSPVQHVWKPCWLYGCGYGDFLREEDALELKYSEWTPFQGNVEEDAFSKLSFRFSREFTFSFPRTTMLMFGPKFAPIKQMQYLFVPDEVSSFEALEKAQPQQAVVLFVTKFEGIPMADVFKVLQYWVIDQSEPQGGGTHIQVGVAIHYIKSSMFKTQILSGTKEEVAGQLKKYAHYAEVRASQYSRALNQEGFKEPSVDGPDRESADQRAAASSGASSGHAPHPIEGIAETAAMSGAVAAATAAVASKGPATSKTGILDLDVTLLFGSSLSGVLILCFALLLAVLLFSSWRKVALLETKVDEMHKMLLETNKLLASILQNQSRRAP